MLGNPLPAFDEAGASLSDKASGEGADAAPRGADQVIVEAKDIARISPAGARQRAGLGSNTARSGEGLNQGQLQVPPDDNDNAGVKLWRERNALIVPNGGAR